MCTSLSFLLGVPISCLRPVNESPDSGIPSSPSANTAGSSVEYFRCKSAAFLLHFLPEPVCTAGVFPSDSLFLAVFVWCL